MNWKARLLYPQNWNIGFVEQSVEDLLEKQQLGRVRWLQHKYKDRWFADPFIYKVTDVEIVVFVEECMITDKPKGILCELHVDRKSMQLSERYVLLELDTHLSYPAFIKKDGVTYVYPENGASGSLKMYRYDENEHKLVEPVCILNEAVADSTILFEGGIYYLIATLSNNSQQGAFLFKSDRLLGSFMKVTEHPVQDGLNCSRPAGNWIVFGEKKYRPSQDCVVRYGNAISMMKVDSLAPFNESLQFVICPDSFKYNRGIHTINYTSDMQLAVVDGYGFFYPILSRLWIVLAKVKYILGR